MAKSGSGVICRDGGVFIDSHVHLYEYGDEVSRYCGNHHLRLIAVSDDLESSIKSVDLGRKCWNVIPAVGIHPWNIGKGAEGSLTRVLELAREVPFIGEVGLDRKFVPQTYEVQLAVFREFLKFATEYGKGLSVHAAGAWVDVLKELGRYGVKAAIIHWYTGPTNLISEIKSLGYYIGVNAAIKKQEKLREVVRVAPLEIIITESDGPYNYRGMTLNPELIPDTVKAIAELKGVNEVEVAEAIKYNFQQVMKVLGITIY